MINEPIQPPFPGQTTTIEPRDGWTALERWVWREIGSGRPADINAYLEATADPERPDEWTIERRISAAFLQSIAFHEPYRSALPRSGMLIIGAWFDQPIDFRDGYLKGGLWLHRCRFEAPVGFNGLFSESVISLERSVFEAKLDMRSLVAEEGLYMRNGARFQSVDLYGARIGRNINVMRASFAGRLIMNAVKVGGNLIGFESEFAADVGLKGATVEGMVDIRRCRFDGRLDMWWLKIGQDLLMGGMRGDDVALKPASFKLLDCRNAKIGGELNLNHVHIADHLNLSSATITNEALLGHQSHFAGIDLRLARIGQNLNLEKASVAGSFDFTAAEIGGDVVCGNARFSGEVDLVFARILGNLDLCDGKFCTIDLTGTSVAGEFRLSDEIEWAAGAELILRNTKVATLHDEPDAWPNDVELDGFVYNGFGGLDADADNDLKRRRSAWFISWLEKDVPHTPQPYRQCAKVLVEMGHPEMADDVLYAGRERGRGELKESGEHMAALGLWFLKITIGYGHGAARYFRTLYWAAGLVALGVAVLMMTGDYLLLDGNIPWQDATGKERLIDAVQAASFSLNKLLPVIELPYHHDRIIFGTAAKLYFQIHKLMGYILALFLLAGITGLTK